MKKYLLISLLLFLPMMVNAEEVEIEGLWYNLDISTNTAEVIQYKNNLKYSGDIIIPAIVKYEGVDFCVTTIGESAFRDCENLKTITFPNSIISVGYTAFSCCNNLESVFISDLAAWCNISFLDLYSNPLSYAPHFYQNGIEIKDLVIPNGVTNIGSYTFYSYKALTSVTIPNSVVSIGVGAFYDCTNLVTVSIPNSVTTIGNSAFRLCSNLTSITIPNSVTSIGIYAFRLCKSLKTITIPNSVTYIGSEAFSECTGLISASIGDGVERLSELTFEWCSNLTWVSIGSGIKNIGPLVFTNCSKIKEVYCYAKTVPITNMDAFNDCDIDRAILNVPEIAYQSYRTTTPWSNFGTIYKIKEEPPVVDKCATPTITYTNGKLRFACETEGVEYVPTVTCKPNKLQNGNELKLGGTFTVSVYAVKEGFDNSDTATMTINISQMGDVNADGELNAADITSVVNAILGK